MSRTKHNTKAPGYEYWSKRPLSNTCGAIPGRYTKIRTHRLERIEAKKIIKEWEDNR